MDFSKVDPRLYMELGKQIGNAYVQNKAADAYNKGSQQQTATESNFGGEDPDAEYTGPGADPVAANPNPEDPTDTPAPRMTNAEAASFGINIPKQDAGLGTGVKRQHRMGAEPTKVQPKEFTPDEKHSAGLRSQMAFYAGRGDNETASRIRGQLNDEVRGLREAADFDQRQKAGTLALKKAERDDRAGTEAETAAGRTREFNSLFSQQTAAYAKLSPQDKAKLAEETTKNHTMPFNVMPSSGKDENGNPTYITWVEGKPRITASEEDVATIYAAGNLMQSHPDLAIAKLGAASKSVQELFKQYVESAGKQMTVNNTAVNHQQQNANTKTHYDAQKATADAAAEARGIKMDAGDKLTFDNLNASYKEKESAITDILKTPGYDPTAPNPGLDQLKKERATISLQQKGILAKYPSARAAAPAPDLLNIRPAAPAAPGQAAPIAPVTSGRPPPITKAEQAAKDSDMPAILNSEIQKTSALLASYGARTPSNAAAFDRAMADIQALQAELGRTTGRSRLAGPTGIAAR